MQVHGIDRRRILFSCVGTLAPPSAKMPCTRKWCTRKWLRFDQTIRTLLAGDLGIPLVVIQLRVTGLKKTRPCIS